MKSITHIIVFVIAFAVVSCSRSSNEIEIGNSEFEPHTSHESFTTSINGKGVNAFTLHTDSLEVCITNYGARIISIHTPDSCGTFRNVLVSLDSIGAYITDNKGTGALEGRLAGELTNRKIKIGDKDFSIDKNQMAWADSVFNVVEQSDTTLTLRLASFAGESGLPGDVGADIKFTLRSRSLLIDYTALPTAETALDLAHRLQFNLNGTGSASQVTTVKAHRLKTNSTQHLALDSLLKPTGHTLMNIWTPFDFRELKPLTYLLNSNADEVKWAKGINTYFVFSTRGEKKEGLLILSSKESGISLQITTDQNGVEIKTPNGRESASIEIMPHNYPDLFNNPGWGIEGLYSPEKPLNYRTTYTFFNSPL